MSRELHSKAKRVSQRVCDLEKGSRTRELRAICEGDLRTEREVRSLLEVDLDNEPGEDPTQQGGDGADPPTP